MSLTKQELEARNAELEKQLAESKSNEADAHLKVDGVYLAKNKKKYSFLKGYVKTRLIGANIPLPSADIIKAANAFNKDPETDGELASKTMEHLVKIGYAGLEIVK